MKNKNFVSLMMAFAFLSLASTGLLIYFDLKPGPVKTIHVLFGLLLIGFAIFHIMNNWGSLKLYMKDRNGGPIKKELIFGSALACIVLLGAGFSIPPFPQIQHFGEDLSRGGEKKGGAGKTLFESVSTNDQSGGQALWLLIQKKKELELPAMVIWTEDSAHHFIQNLFVPEKVASLPPGEKDIREALEEGEVKFEAMNPASFPAWSAVESDRKSNHAGTTPFDAFILDTRTSCAAPYYLNLEIVSGRQHSIYRAMVDPSKSNAFSLHTSDEQMLERALLELK